MRHHFQLSICLVVFSSAMIPPSTFAADQKVEFNRDIRPILSNNCFNCHGPDQKQRQAGLR
ncbi:MAG: hypothetical protein FJ267_05050, partial [Planctomycetes bacterium]|nr:hypothetical protein [Planctomycetota bacterium]